MINSVRNTVLSILNKNNYGYVSPTDFNLFAKQAQLDIFEDYFYQYNYQINKENSRQSGTGYADIKKGYEEVIDTFSITADLIQVTPGTPGSNTFFMPSVATTGSDYYLINKVLCGVNFREAERVHQNKITLLSQSLLTAPSTMYPAYSQQGGVITILPTTYENVGDITCQYIRYPKNPVWTFITLSGGEPVFDQTAADFQDFELPLDDEPSLIMKILQYAGMSIREIEAVQFATGQENMETQKEK